MSMAEAERRRTDFLEALEDERRKIQMFSRELPLTLQLINEEIDNLRRRMASEDSPSERPVFEDFMRIKPMSSSSRSDGELNNEKASSDCTPDWLRSVHLKDITAAEEPSDERGTLKKPVAVNARRVWGAFQPFERNKLVTAAPAPFTAHSVSSTTVMTMERRKDVGGEVQEEEERQSLAPMGANRKHRRCWSPDLHRKFLNALEALGGSHVATPKQIREMMKVDSLTNDEVKSHLQKYRLHTKRPVTTAHNSIGTRAPPHFVLLGSIWAPPHEYASAAVAAERTEGRVAALKETYSHAASLPLELRLQEEQSAKKQQRNKPSSGAAHSERMVSQDDDSLLDDAATKSNSSSLSFSSQTTTVLPSS